jgi:CDP-glucose 4,6-dehydratase
MTTSSPLEFEAILAGRRIFLTGHTGFTGSWVGLWLEKIGAKVVGFSLEPETRPSLFYELGAAHFETSIFGDICDYKHLHSTIEAFQPELILHLAAQPLVRRSYREPLQTFLVNAQGTANVLESARLVKSVKAVVCVTTDKVYKNNEWEWPYRENDPLGGKDPYSASKAAAEMIIQSYSASYPAADNLGPWIATARGGNIIGGGDWSEDRLIPDFARSINQNSELAIRYPNATRPWQHVLALAYGYLMLSAKLLSDQPSKYARAWNLGPQELSQYSVKHVLELMSTHWKTPKIIYENEPLAEARSLALDSSIARNILGWVPPWGTDRVVAETASWYRSYYDGSTARKLTLEQIELWREELAGK